MKIAIVSRADSIGGGASRVASNICEVFRAAGHSADHWRLENSGTTGEDGNCIYGRGLRRDVLNLLRGAQHSIGLVEVLPLELAEFGRAVLKNGYDIIHFHDITWSVSPLTILVSSFYCPTLWTFHDYSPFTGGCIYPDGCNKYLKDCKVCPQYNNWPLGGRFDFADRLLAIKKIVHRYGKFTSIAPSAWMAETAYASGNIRQRPLVIHNGVDTEKFKPRNKHEIRRHLGLPVDRKVVVLLAHNLEDPRKGVHYAVDALKSVKASLNPFILAIGQKSSHFIEAISDFDHSVSGYVACEEYKSQLYSAADVFLNCSLADNLPLVVLETAACGVPTVGFATGGIPEIVEQNGSGYLAPMFDAKSLTEALDMSLSGDVAGKWGARARQIAENEFSFERLYERHLTTYEQCVEKFKKAR